MRENYRISTTLFSVLALILVSCVSLSFLSADIEVVNNPKYLETDFNITCSFFKCIKTDDLFGEDEIQIRFSVLTDRGRKIDGIYPENGESVNINDSGEIFNMILGKFSLRNTENSAIVNICIFDEDSHLKRYPNIPVKDPNISVVLETLKIFNVFSSLDENDKLGEISIVLKRLEDRSFSFDYKSVSKSSLVGNYFVISDGDYHYEANFDINEND